MSRSYKVPGAGPESHCPDSPSGAHWWLIGSPGAFACEGKCRYCGEGRVFPTSGGVDSVRGGQKRKQERGGEAV